MPALISNKALGFAPTVCLLGSRGRCGARAKALAVPTLPRAATPPPGADRNKEVAHAQEDLDAMSVTQLRRFARTVPNLAIKGREISRADKQRSKEHTT